jgi:hypothetical protein
MVVVPLTARLELNVASPATVNVPAGEIVRAGVVKVEPPATVDGIMVNDPGMVSFEASCQFLTELEFRKYRYPDPFVFGAPPIAI